MYTVHEYLTSKAGSIIELNVGELYDPVSLCYLFVPIKVGDKTRYIETVGGACPPVHHVIDAHVQLILLLL